MARLNCMPPESMSFREFLVHVENIKKDVEKEEEAAQKQAAKARANKR